MRCGGPRKAFQREVMCSFPQSVKVPGPLHPAGNRMDGTATFLELNSRRGTRTKITSILTQLVMPTERWVAWSPFAPDSSFAHSLGFTTFTLEKTTQTSTVTPEPGVGRGLGVRGGKTRWPHSFSGQKLFHRICSAAYSHMLCCKKPFRFLLLGFIHLLSPPGQ